ncbi:MAG: hypothetical protein ACR2OZ_18050 [Verrucomicrobiales bacterium]
MSSQEAIKSLSERGWSQRRIAAELCVNRRSVRRYAGEQNAKCTNSTPGPEGSLDSKCTISTPGSPEASGGAGGRASPGRRSSCEPLAEAIAGKLEKGLSAQRIYQDLVSENAFSGSYQAVKRHVRGLKAKDPEQTWRVEWRAGEEAQVDFGLGAPIDHGQGGSRRKWVFRVVLSLRRLTYQ